LKRLILLLVIAAWGTGWAQLGEYQGPTILSRGLGPVLQGGGDLLRIRPFLSLTGRYDAGVTPVSVDANGEVPSEDIYGGEAQFGVYGYHRWRRSLLGLDYRGNIRHYAHSSYYDGSDHALALNFSHQPSRRVAFTLREAAGTYSRTYGMYRGYAYFDPAFANVPTNEMFDGRTYYASTMGDLTFMKSPRLSFNFGGSGLIVRRRSEAFVDVTGWTSRGDVQYRLSRTASVGADYGFTHYEFTNAFGASDMHSLAVNLAFRLGRSWDLGLRAGAFRVESLGLQQVAVDPIIAAIIGRTTGVEALYRLNYVPIIQASLSRVFRRSSLSFNYDSLVTPGNGMYLTSRSQDGTVSYSYTAFRRWNLGVSAGYSNYSSVWQTIAKYQNVYGGGGVSCQVKTWMHIVARYDARLYEATGVLSRRVMHSGSFGVAFSPGELPLSLW
jgi:hypothetical protein